MEEGLLPLQQRGTDDVFFSNTFSSTEFIFRGGGGDRKSEKKYEASLAGFTFLSVVSRQVSKAV
jgi:hypothetical protein